MKKGRGKQLILSHFITTIDSFVKVDVTKADEFQVKLGEDASMTAAQWQVLEKDNSWTSDKSVL